MRHLVQPWQRPGKCIPRKESLPGLRFPEASQRNEIFVGFVSGENI